MNTERLREAARLINKALLELDTKMVDCCTCQRPTFRNRLHAKIYEHLCGIPDKLLNDAERLDNAIGNMGPSAGFEESLAASALHHKETD